MKAFIFADLIPGSNLKIMVLATCLGQARYLADEHIRASQRPEFSGLDINALADSIYTTENVQSVDCVYPVNVVF